MGFDCNNSQFFQNLLLPKLGSLVKMCSNIDLLCAVIYPEDKKQRDEVENSKQVLAEADVPSMAGDVVKSCEDVNKACRIPAKV